MTTEGFFLRRHIGPGGRRGAVGILAMLLAIVLVPAAVSANGPASSRLVAPGQLAVLRAERAIVIPKAIPAPRNERSSRVSANITVAYTGFTQAAKDAFQRSVNTWKTKINSNQTIHVNAHWKPLGTGVLGSAGPSLLFIGPDNKLVAVALAEATCHCNLNGTGKEIDANFNSNFTDWYLGTGTVPNGKWDLQSVVLHELGHGLGFFSTMEVGGSIGRWGLGGTHKDKYDAQEWTALSGGLKLAKQANFANNSTALKNALENPVWFGGANVVASLGHRAKLYSPNTFEPGSSNSHFDDATFDGTSNALMTHALFDGESDHNTGTLVLKLFRDIGWVTA